MQTITFSVQGSSVDPYEVRFNFDGSEISAFCSCQAGQNGQTCKHRLEILSGKSSQVISKNIADVKKVSELFIGTRLENKLNQLWNTETELESIQKKIKVIKKEVAKIMNGQ